MNANSEIPQQINEVVTLPSSVQDDLSTNGSGTDSKSGTQLTQWRSPTVRTLEVFGYTYFIRVGNSIKVGSTGDFEQRLKNLQTAHAKPIKVLAVVPATVADEQGVHQVFSGLRIRGEWFRADRELLYFIEQVKADARAAEEAARRAGAKSLPPPLTPFEILRRPLYALRKGRKANDPIAHACHNLIELSKNLEAAKDKVQIGHIKKSMDREGQRLERLRAAA